MRSLVLAFCLLLVAQLHAEERLFFQPLNADSRLQEQAWRDIWRASADAGVKTLLVQWTAYGEADFGGADGWLANSLRAAQEQGLQLVLGLYMDPAYYQRQRELDAGRCRPTGSTSWACRWRTSGCCASSGSCPWPAGTCRWSWTTCSSWPASGARCCAANCRISPPSSTRRCT